MLQHDTENSISLIKEQKDQIKVSNQFTSTVN